MFAAAGADEEDVHSGKQALFRGRWCSMDPCDRRKQNRLTMTDAAAPECCGIDRLRALGRAQAHGRGPVSAMCGCAARFPAIAGRIPPATVYFALKDDKRAHRRGDLAGHHRAALQVQARGGLEVDRHRQHHHLSRPSKYQIVIETLEPAGARRADGAARGAQAEARRRRPVRRGAQAAAAVPAARDRRRHLADRRRDPRHPAPARRPLPAPRAGLAGAGAGRRRGREVAAAIDGLQRAAGGRADPAARRADRGARRRLARGSVGLQRGDRGARGGGSASSR